tara:strand:- start:1479 stop:2189 length:711 start_codon:yes stop_codon:yes gene_type:complete
MNKSENINELAAALSRAQNEMGGAVKDSKNPFFKSNYADLTSVIKTIKQPFVNNGLSYAQFPVTSSGGNGVGVKTILMHLSGQWIEEEFYLPLAKQDPQAAGSAITYARRYSLAALAGIPSVDDDSEASMMRGKPQEEVITVDRSVNQDYSHETKAKACADAVDNNREALDYIRKHLAIQNGLQEGSEKIKHYEEAMGAWATIPEEDQLALWVAPSKYPQEAFFSTLERKQIKQLA